MSINAGAVDSIRIGAVNISYPATHARAVARVTLVLWLLAFAAGVANACLLDTGPDHQAQARATVASASEPADDCDSALAEQACRSQRSLEQGALAKVKALDGAENLPVLALVASWRVLAAAPPPRVPQIAAAPPPGLPVAIRFLRLTL